MLLYIHVPFCQSRCAYCAFYSEPLSLAKPLKACANMITQDSQVASNLDLPKEAMPKEAMQDWLEGIIAEINYWGERLERPEISTIFFGGGTPSLLPDKIIEAIIIRLDKSFTFAKGIEISLEGNPDSAGESGYLYSLFKIGVNRLSLGVQSLDDSTLQLLGRTHTVRHALNTYNVARQAGFNNISLDLMWGLPGQRPIGWLNTLKEITKLKPEHLSCYGLSIEPKTKLHSLVETEKVVLPNEREQSLMFMQGAEFLEELGYIHYEISNFARMGFQSVHNMGYWQGQDYLGFGPSASSTLDGKRWMNDTDSRQWYQSVKAGKFAQNAELIDQRTKILELVMLRLRTAKGLNLNEFSELSGRNFMSENKNIVEALHKKRLLRIKNGNLSLSNNGMLVSNAIIEALMSRV